MCVALLLCFLRSDPLDALRPPSLAGLEGLQFPTNNHLPPLNMGDIPPMSSSISPAAEFYNYGVPSPMTPMTPQMSPLISPNPEVSGYNHGFYSASDFANALALSHYFPQELRVRASYQKFVGKERRKRATGKTSYDKQGKKVITAATCVACFKSKKKCLYQMGASKCTLCSKRNQECVQRIDRRCQKIWNETGRTMTLRPGQSKKTQMTLQRAFMQKRMNNDGGKN